MADWDRAKALGALEAFNLTGTNAELALYWLSLWDGDRPPHRSQFNPARVRDLLPAIGLTQVESNGNAVCRVAGRFIDMVFGQSMSGANVLDLVKGEERLLRSSRLLAIVQGHLGLSHTRYTTPENGTAVAETIQLPFFGATEDGSRQYVTHTIWRPTPSDFLVLDRARADGRPDTYFSVSFLKG
jgi:hypothetical protein